MNKRWMNDEWKTTNKEQTWRVMVTANSTKINKSSKHNVDCCVLIHSPPSSFIGLVRCPRCSPSSLLLSIVLLVVCPHSCFSSSTFDKGGEPFIPTLCWLLCFSSLSCVLICHPLLSSPLQSSPLWSSLQRCFWTHNHFFTVHAGNLHRIIPLYHWSIVP